MRKNDLNTHPRAQRKVMRLTENQFVDLLAEAAERVAGEMASEGERFFYGFGKVTYELQEYVYGKGKVGAPVINDYTEDWKYMRKDNIMDLLKRAAENFGMDEGTLGWIVDMKNGSVRMDGDMVDENGSLILMSDFELWKAGKKRLWQSEYVFWIVKTAAVSGEELRQAMPDVETY